MVEAQYTSRTDGSTHAAPLPDYAFSAAAEGALFTHCWGRRPGEVLRACVEPAFIAGSDEVIAFAIVDESERVIGAIARNSGGVTGAINDGWEKILERGQRDVKEQATYVLRRGVPAPLVPMPAGIRLVETASDWPYAFVVPEHRDLNLAAAVPFGETGGGLVERIFDAVTFQEMTTYFLSNLEEERMGALHGKLWVTSGSKDALVPYVLYEDFITFDGQSSAASVHVNAEAQAASATHRLPLAALIHSHPYQKPEDDKAAEEPEEAEARGPVCASPTDLTQLRRALCHVHQASFVASLPRQPGKPLVLVPYGYNAQGEIQSEPGFWVADATGRFRERPCQSCGPEKKEVPA